jgi:hypothetical protein
MRAPRAPADRFAHRHADRDGGARSLFYGEASGFAPAAHHGRAQRDALARHGYANVWAGHTGTHRHAAAIADRHVHAYADATGY